MELLHILATDPAVQKLLAQPRVAEQVAFAERRGSMAETRLVRGAAVLTTKPVRCTVLITAGDVYHTPA